MRRRIPNLVDLSIGSPEERKAIADFIKRMKASTRKIKAGDKIEMAKCRKRLISAGICTPTGRLTKHYR